MDGDSDSNARREIEICEFELFLDVAPKISPKIALDFGSSFGDI